MSSKQGGAGKGPLSRSASGRRAALVPPPPPLPSLANSGSLPSVTSLPSLAAGATSPKAAAAPVPVPIPVLAPLPPVCQGRFGDGTAAAEVAALPGEDGLGGAAEQLGAMQPLQRPPSQAPSQHAARPLAPFPDFWSHHTAPQLLETTICNPELKLQLLTRALEESRGKLQQVQRDRAALSDALGQLCLAAGTAEVEAVTAAAPTVGDDEALLQRRLELLGAQLAQLREAVKAREVTVTEAQAQHERTAIQVVAQQQQREALEQQLEEARYTVQQHEQAQRALQVKVTLLEEQLGASADSSRQRIEEQLDTFREGVLMARMLRNKYVELERQLDAAQHAQYADAEHSSRLAAQVKQLQGQLKEASVKQLETGEQLWDKSVALTDLTEKHRELQASSMVAASDNCQLREALTASQQRAQRAEDLGTGLHAQCHAAQQLQAVLQEEAERLRTELQQEREQKHQLQTALAEERLVTATHRATLQGKGEEIASLCLKLDEYSGRIVALEGVLEGAAQRAEQEAAQQAQHDNNSLHDLQADLADTEARWKQQLEQVECKLAEVEVARSALDWKSRQQERTAATDREHVQMMQATLAEQAWQLKQMTALQQQVVGQQQQLADLRGELHAAAAHTHAVQATADELAAAKQQLKRELHKQEMFCRRLQEQLSEARASLQTTTKGLVAATASAEAASAQVAEQREEHAAGMQALEQQHKRRKARNVHLEHECRQQAIIIAELQAATTLLSAQLEATRQHNAALHQYAVAHGAAYGRLSAHAVGLHQQFVRQVAGLLHLCHHLGLQFTAAMAAADPVAYLQANCSASTSSRPSPAAAASPSGSGGSTATGAAALLCIESLRTELQVAVQLLEQQGSGSKLEELATVPTDIALALEADLEGLPAALLESPRLEQDGTASMAAAAAGVEAARSSAATGSSSSSRGQQRGSHMVTPAVPNQHASNSIGGATKPAKSPASAMSAQVFQMEAHLERLMHGSAEHAARAAAATQLQEQEREARQQAQDFATELSSRLAAMQADLDATREKRDQLEGQSRQLAGDLRDAIYSLSQVHAQRHGQVVSWAVRGLTSTAVQTQYCALWEANLAGAGAGDTHQCSSGGGACVASCGSGNGSVLWAAAQDSSSGSGRDSSQSSGTGSEDGDTAGRGMEEETDPGVGAAAQGRTLPLAAVQQLIRDIYQAKAQQDIAVARGQRPFQPLADFVVAYLGQQYGFEGPAVQQRAQQLQASVEAHATVWEVGLFGLAAGMLEEACTGSPLLPGAAPAILVMPPGSTAGASSPTTATAAAGAVPLFLYHSRRRRRTPIELQHGATLSSLRRFCAATWHAAFQASAARQPLPQPFSPAGPGQLVHSIAAEVHTLALSVPGIEQLMGWVLNGGLGACLPQLDLGLRLAENQVPQLYLLAVESCRLLGLVSTPQLYVKSSNEAAAYYMLLSGTARLHGLNGGSAEPAPLLTSARAVCSSGGMKVSSSVVSSRLGLDAGNTVVGGSSGLNGITPGYKPGSDAMENCGQAAAEPQDWQCVLVLTSGLLDLLEPAELQAVMTGCLGFHAAITYATGGASPAPAANKEAAQLAQLCRSMAALATLGALCSLAPDMLSRRLPQQMAPFFLSRMRPVLGRALQYLALYCDRVAAAGAGGWRLVAAALIKQATGATVLRGELNLDAVIQQAQELDDATAELLPKALLREDSATVAGATPSLALLRIRELQKWAATVAMGW